MFERLSESFQGLYKRLSGQDKITESNVREAMGDVRKALLEADVSVEAVEAFTQHVLDDALGTQVTKSLAPGEEMIGIVHKHLVSFLGGTPGAKPVAPGESSDPVMRISPGPAVVMLCGLQGSGKTTTAGKLAGYLKKRGRSVMLVAADLQRPAAVEQLQIVANQVQTELPGGSQVHFYAEPEKCAEYGKAVGVAVQICQRAIQQARKLGVDTVILDTAGRLHVNDELMGELAQVSKAVQPHHIFLVVDSMSGQDALVSAKAFHARLPVDGIVLTKFDSDSRGGAAISVKHVTGASIKLVGTGEKLDAIEEFHADRMAGRILGMGDVVSLVEKAQQEVSQEDAERLSEKMARGEMSMDDFLGQLRTLRRMGPLKQLMGLIPGVGQMMKNIDVDESRLDRIEAIVCSMTKAERKDPSVLNNSRRNRVARGSGVQVHEVSEMVKQFEGINRLTKQMAGLTPGAKAQAVRQIGRAGAGDMSALQSLPGMRRGSTHTESVKSKFKKRKK
jgi:signal recognition particle subunit SRP54